MYVFIYMCKYILVCIPLHLLTQPIMALFLSDSFVFASPAAHQTPLGLHKRLIYKEPTSTHAEGADQRVGGLVLAGSRVAWSPAISRRAKRTSFAD